MNEEIKMELYNDNFQNFKHYAIPRAQLVIADIPYNVGNNFYGSNPEWYIDGDNSNGESDKAGKAAFNTDYNFNIVEYFHFCNKLLVKEPTEKLTQRGRSSDAPCMIIFCAFEQLNFVIETAAKYGFKHYIPLVFVKRTSPQVLKANMRVCGAVEYALILYRGKLPKFRNGGGHDKKLVRMDTGRPRMHPESSPDTKADKGSRTVNRDIHRPRRRCYRSCRGFGFDTYRSAQPGAPRLRVRSQQTAVYKDMPRNDDDKAEHVRDYQGRGQRANVNLRVGGIV